MTQQEFTERYKYDASADLLGEGGFGRVYRAYDNEEHEYVALKMQAVDPKHPELRLRNEVEKVQQYHHRYIARYKECYTFATLNGDMDVAVMKYYKDGSLDQLLNSGRLGIEERFTLLRQMLEGIAFLHSHGIIHRDLKPQNVLIVEHDGRYSPLITDFGISKQLTEGESSAVSNSILGGTYAYASPEQLKEATIRKNTDLWSFGVIAYFMLTGTRPFNCGTFSPTSQEGRQEQFRQMTSGILPEALNGVPEPWQTLIRECLVVDNTKRIAHAEDALKIVARPISGDNIKLNPDDKNSSDNTIVDGNAKEDKEPVPNPTTYNKLYRSYGIKALVSALLSTGLGFLASILHMFSYTSYSDPVVAIDNDMSYICSMLYYMCATGAWLSLAFTFVSVRGFTRVQLSPNDANAARTVSWGVLLAIISWAMGNVVWVEPMDEYWIYGPYVLENSYFPHVWDFICNIILFTAIITAVVGVTRLSKSQFQPAGARSGFSWVSIFLFIELAITLLLFILAIANMLVGGGWFTTAYWIVSVFEIFAFIILIIGACRIIKSKQEVSTDDYNALCEANDEAKSESHSIRVWFYCMGALFTIITLICLYNYFAQALYLCSDGYPGVDITDYTWVSELYHSSIGSYTDYSMLSAFNCFLTLTIFALASWMLFRPSMRRNKGIVVGLIGMIVSSLIIPITFTTVLFIGLFEIDLTFMYAVKDIILLATEFVLYGFITYLILDISILIFAWSSRTNLFAKIALSICLIPQCIDNLIAMAYEACRELDISSVLVEWHRNSEFINTYYTWNDYVYIATLVPILLLAGTFVVRKSGWTKWVMIGLAALFSIFTLYTTIKINSMENKAKEWEENNLEYNSEYDYYY